MRVSVIGGSDIDADTATVAQRTGELLAANNHAVVCGGLGGVMRAVCQGAREAGGETIGILPGSNPAAANRYVSTPIATGLGNARNVLVVLNGAGTIAIDGGTGTLSEIGHVLDFGRPVAGLETHSIAGVTAVDSPDAAVEYFEQTVNP